MNSFNKKTKQDMRIEKLRSERDSLRLLNNQLKVENERLTQECENLYNYFAEMQELETKYNEEIYKLKELNKSYTKEKNSYIALKRDYEKAMNKFFNSLR